MAIKASDQISIVDLTDGVSVTLTSESHIFPGTTSAAKAGSVTTQIIAMRGTEQVVASVILSEITKPSGVTVTSDNDTTSPTLTIAVDTTVKTNGVVTIPIHVDDLTIVKEFSFAIAFTGANGTSVTIKSTAVTYQASESPTTTPTGEWSATIPTVPEGQYLWTKTVVTYSDGKSTTAYGVSRVGADGTSVSVKSTEVTYKVSTSGTTTPTGTWSTTIPTVPKGQYLWTKTVVTYSDGKSTTSYSVTYNGSDGKNGEDAITLSVTSSNGTIFKNTAIATVFTAHVYKAGAELTAAQINALGAIKWYKDGGETAVATGLTLTIDAGDVSHRAVYVAQLEG